MYRRFLQLLGRFMLLPMLFSGTGAGIAATFVVTNTADSGAGSLRQAMLDANATPNVTAGVPDEIHFNIPSSIPGMVSRYHAEGNADDAIGAPRQLIERQGIGGSAIDQHASVDDHWPEQARYRDRSR